MWHEHLNHTAVYATFVKPKTGKHSFQVIGSIIESDAFSDQFRSDLGSEMMWGSLWVYVEGTTQVCLQFTALSHVSQQLIHQDFYSYVLCMMSSIWVISE